MREWIKALPLGLGLPVMIGAASVKPEDAASNIGAWIEWLGFHNLPHWLTSPNADQHVIAAACFAAAVYSFAVWGPVRKWRGDGVLTWGPWILIVGGPLLGIVWLAFASRATPVSPSEISAPKTTHPGAVAAVEPNKPESLEQLFKTDFERTLRSQVEILFHTPSGNDKATMQMYYDFDAGTYFIGLHVPTNPRTFFIIQSFAEGYQKPADDLRNSLLVTSRDPADTKSVTMNDFTFSKRIYVYHETDLSVQEIAALDSFYQSKGLVLQLRGSQYATTRWLQKSVSKAK